MEGRSESRSFSLNLESLAVHGRSALYYPADISFQMRLVPFAVNP
jgi:hypothetical protein